MKFAVLFPHLGERQRRLFMGPRAGCQAGGVRELPSGGRAGETAVRKACTDSKAARYGGRTKEHGGRAVAGGGLQPAGRPRLR
ncbi:hypothetical protein T261_08966 [Streptomyces lydicus]|nr:hypothetical protein T261_0048 [Streptomyces lydicus]AQY20684.1 hypothetical protein T261_08966 [Streptomyces lydicus]